MAIANPVHLKGAALSWALAIAEEKKPHLHGQQVTVEGANWNQSIRYFPHQSWSARIDEIGNDVINRERIGTWYVGSQWWAACKPFDDNDMAINGDSNVEAAIRYYLYNKFPNGIEIPDELVR